MYVSTPLICGDRRLSGHYIYMIRGIHTSLVVFTTFGRDDLQEKIEIGGKLLGVKYEW